MWDTKLVLLVLLSAFSAFLLVRNHLPAAAAADDDDEHHFSIDLPELWASVRVYLGPGYLFVTVNFIILIIWKLSDKKQRHGSGDRPVPAETPLKTPRPSPEVWHSSPPLNFQVPSGYDYSYNSYSPSPPPPDTNFQVPSGYDNSNNSYSPSPPPPYFVSGGGESESSPGSRSDASCVTTDSDESPAVSSRPREAELLVAEKPAVPSSPPGEGPVKRRVEPTETTAETVAEEKPAVRPRPTSKRTVKRSVQKVEAVETTTEPPKPEAATPEVRIPAKVEEVWYEPALGHDELNRRFDAFIKKVNDQMRQQRFESSNRRYKLGVGNNQRNSWAPRF